MHEYDTVLKSLLQSSQNIILERITGTRVERWLNVEFPEVQQTRVDLLGATANPEHLIGLELQSTNDPNLPLRMAEYALRTYRLYSAFPDQYVLYVGDEDLRMRSELVGPNFSCRHKIFDIRTVDEESLLASPVDRVLDLCGCVAGASRSAARVGGLSSPGLGVKKNDGQSFGAE